ncbi:MAG: thioredoxin domain-containing protein [Acidobacteria bacterium]|nr:thioredoxin domain-containing protein [Acidobacteriota bacterium]
MIYFVIVFLSGSSLLLGQAPPSTELARIGATPITQAEIDKAAASELETLQLDRQRFEIDQKRKRHDITQNTLERVISERLLKQEAAEQKLTADELLAREVTAVVKAPTDLEVERFFEANKTSFQSTTKEQALPQIREYLRQQASQATYKSFIDRLKQKHKVEYRLTPFRIEMAAEGFPSQGAADAPVVLVEFSDFQCPFCLRFLPTLKQIREKYGDRVRIVFRQFPLSSIHPQAQKAAEASLCAADQGRFWEMHDLLFADQKLTPEELKKKAESLGIQMPEFNDCLNSGKKADLVNEDLRAGVVAGVTGTPSSFINGRLVVGAVPFENIAKVIDEELQAASKK